MEGEIKPIRKQKNDDEYKTKESVRITAHNHYFEMKKKSPEKYKDKIKKNKERYHNNKRKIEILLRN